MWQMLPQERRNNLWIYWVLAPSMIIFMTYNFDMLVLFEVILAFYFLKKGKPLSAAAMFALGFSTKFFPIFYLLPLFVAQENWKQRGKVLASFAGTTLLVNGFFMLANFRGWYYFYRFNSVRAFSLDSIWTVVTPWFQPLLNNISILNAVSLLLLAWVVLWFVYKYRRLDVITVCFYITLIYAVFTKVFTPQHILWFLPFFVLVHQPRKILYYGLEASNFVILCQVLYYRYFPADPYYLIKVIEPVTIVRFIFLILIVAAAVKQVDLPQETSNVRWQGFQVPARFRHAIAAGIFAILTLGMTWPLVTHITTSYPSTFQNFGGDPNMYVSYIDLVYKDLSGNLPVSVDQMLFYPGGVNFYAGYEGAIMMLVALPTMALSHNPILAYNLILLLAFFLTAYCSYRLIWYFTNSYSAALTSGFAFGFSTYMMVRGLQHLDLLFLFTVPLLVLATFKFYDQPNYKSVIWLGLSVLLVALSAWYYLIGGLIFLGLVFLSRFRSHLVSKKFYAYAALAIAIAVLIPAAPLLLNSSSQATTNANTLVDRAGAQPLNYILPHPFAVIWSWLTHGIYEKFPSVYEEPYPYFEQSSYFGLVGLIAVLVLFFGRKKFEIPHRKLWIWTLIIFSVLALGNYLQIGKWQIAMPFALLRKMFPFDHLRAPNRFFVFAYLASTVVFGYFIAQAKTFLPNPNWRRWWGIILLLALFSERWMFPYPLVTVPVSQFYKDLRNEPGNFAVVDVPVARLFGDSSYNYFQVVHSKPIVDGEFFWTVYDDHTFDYINSNKLLMSSVTCKPDLNNIDPNPALEDLAAHNIRYVIVHNFILHDYKNCPGIGIYVHKFFQGQRPVFADGELTVYATFLTK
ncbi:MAG: glycosyltransferase 87 family protein [Candidatus Doudnabacteria bacterium]|nr:glycosyltransferase 87 family protein [Candidatus Doudnabacteria bacterium]